MSAASSAPSAAAADASAVVLITGARGLLGRAVLAAVARTRGLRAVGTSRTAPAALPAGASYLPFDLVAGDARALLASARGARALIHCAAERRPDVCEGDPAGSEALNVAAVWSLARAAAAAGCAFIYVSTDYVFDGAAPPYAPDAPPRPLNAYGAQKLRGEWAARAAHAGAVVLRVPLLYGASADAGESAATALARAVVARRACALDDWQVRAPTHTRDVAATLAALAAGAARAPGAPPPPPPGVLHYSTAQRFTRYTLALRIAALLRAPASHLQAAPGAPPPGGTPRPHDASLDCAATLPWAAPCTPFDAGMAEVLAGFAVVGGELVPLPAEAEAEAGAAGAAAAEAAAPPPVAGAPAAEETAAEVTEALAPAAEAPAAAAPSL